MSALDEIVKAYDIRGTVPDQLDAEIAHALGVGFAEFCGTDRVLLARDMRRSGAELADAFARGLLEQGVDVVDLGLGSTDLCTTPPARSTPRGRCSPLRTTRPSTTGSSCA
jgi:phosphomannomutase